ncbi:MAG TPA: hypothetical protein V6C89_10585 [Drouetiella sp.]
MINTKYAILLMLATIACGALPARSNDSGTKTITENDKENLRRWCILPAEIGSVSALPCHLGVPESRRTQRFEFMRKIRHSGEGLVAAVCEIEPNGEVILNPTNLNYGPIPAVPNLTLSQADMLWGDDTTVLADKNKRTYQLASFDNQISELEIEFNDQLISRYRIRGPQLTFRDWTVVKREGANAPPLKQSTL